MLNVIVFPQLAVHFRNKHWEGMFCGLWCVATRRRSSPKRMYGNIRVVALGHDLEWPPRSPDLTLCDFFLWGYLKNKVFSTPRQDIDVLCQRITDTFNELRQQPDFVRRAVRTMLRRAEICTARNGRHVEGHSALDKFNSR